MADRPPIRYAIYTRQSNQGLFDFSSCDAQFLTCQNHIEPSQMRALPQVVDQIEVNRKITVIQITFNCRLIEIVSTCT